jgi:hypothetical protein
MEPVPAAMVDVADEEHAVSQENPSPKPRPGLDEPVTRTPTEARQASRRGRMIWVLLGSLALIGIAYALIYSVTSVPNPSPRIGVETAPVGPSSSGQPQPPAAR